MKNFILIHGMSSHLDESFGIKIKERIKNHGFEIIEPFFPLKHQISLENWTEELDKFQKYFNDKTCFLCHSLGCVFIIKYLFKRKIKAHAIISIAGADFDEKNSLGEKYPQLYDFKELEEEYEYAKNNVKYFFNIYSDDDNVLTQDSLISYTKKTGATGIIIKGRGHFGRSSGVRDIPEIENILNKISEN